MDWISDYFQWALSNGPGGLIAFGLSAFAVLLVVLGLLAGVAAASRAFRKGWNGAGESDSAE